MHFEADVDNDSIREIFEKLFSAVGEDYAPSWEWVKIHPQLHCWIDGEYVEEMLHSTCTHPMPPAYDGFRCDVPVLDGESYVTRAVESARAAQALWIRINPDTRQELLLRLSKVLQSKSKLITHLSHLDEEYFDLIIEYFNFAADLSIDKWEAVGTILIKISGLTPAWVVAMHVSSALAAGCSVIINPSQKACFFSFILAEMCKEAGLPKGLVNVVPGKKNTYHEFLRQDIHKLIYNGILDIQELSSFRMPQYLSVLAPNHTASILLETCDVQAALDQLFDDTWKNLSKTLWGVGVLVVQQSIYQDFLRALNQKIKNWGDGFFENVVLRDALLDVMRRGIKVVHDPDDSDKLVPIAVTQDDVDFGDIPAITMQTFRTPEEAAAIVNRSPYCIATSVWTENCSQALQLTERIDSSIVWINCHGVTDATISFEPSGKSGIGSFGGLEGVLENRVIKPMEVEYNYESSQSMECCSLQGGLITEAVRVALSSFRRWKHEKTRSIYLKDIVERLVSKHLSRYTADLNVWANMGNSYELLKGCKKPDMHALQNKRPIGVILMVLFDSPNPLEAFSSFVSPAIAFGNAVIVVMNSELASDLSPLIDCYIRCLPTGVLNVFEGIMYAPILASKQYVHAVSLCTDQPELLPEIQHLRKISMLHMKRFWVQPSIDRNMSECPKRFLKEQTTFLVRPEGV